MSSVRGIIEAIDKLTLDNFGNYKNALVEENQIEDDPRKKPIDQIFQDISKVNINSLPDDKSLYTESIFAKIQVLNSFIKNDLFTEYTKKWALQERMRFLPVGLRKNHLNDKVDSNEAIEILGKKTIATKMLEKEIENVRPKLNRRSISQPQIAKTSKMEEQDNFEETKSLEGKEEVQNQIKIKKANSEGDARSIFARVLPMLPKRLQNFGTLTRSPIMNKK
jgi:hypothetical protein